MKIGPKNDSVHVLHSVEHVMMIVPINPNINKTEDIAEKYRKKRLKSAKVIARRRFHLENHDGDDNGDHSISEGF